MAAASAVVALADAERRAERRIVGAAMPIALGADKAPPEWVRLLPAGTFSLNDGRGSFTNAAPQAVIDKTKAWLGGRDAPADYDHLSEYVQQTGQPSIAAGWIKDWRVVDGAIEARVEWTPKADQAIRDKEYRYLSPVFATDAAKQVVQLFGFALTNQPAINDLPALAASQTQTQQETIVSKLIAQALGLPETASEAELVAAATTLRQNFTTVIAASGAKASDSVDTIVGALREKPDPAKWIAASEYQRVTGELATVVAARDELQKKAAGDEVETVIAAALKDGKLMPAQKNYWTEICASAGSAEPLKKFLETAPVVVKPGELQLDGRAPGSTTTITAAQLNARELEHCTKNGLKPESYAREITKHIAAGGIRPLAA